MASLFERYPQLLVNVESNTDRPLEDCPHSRGKFRRHVRNWATRDAWSCATPYGTTFAYHDEGPDETRLKALAEAIAGARRKVLGQFDPWCVWE